jgi:hypothetical protein
MVTNWGDPVNCVDSNCGGIAGAYFPQAMKFLLDPCRQPLSIDRVHLRERQPSLALLGCPNDLSFAAQLFPHVGKVKLKLNCFASAQLRS